MIVQKFGGTSVQDAASIRRVVGIVTSEPCREKIVVVSALAGVTNRLLEMTAQAAAGRLDVCREIAGTLKARHLDVARDLLQPSSLEEADRKISSSLDHLEKLAESVSIIGEASPRTHDAFSSTGELLSSLIVHGAFVSSGAEAVLLDARSFMLTDDAFTQASLDREEAKRAIRRVVLPPLQASGIVVTQGYIGATAGGVTTTLGRGGSDLSASLIGSLLDAAEIQIWTDVDGVLTADPSLIPGAKNIESMSFREASELAYFGARVLHPNTILPAISAGIPVVVRNSLRPELRGTIITEKPARTNGIVKSIAYKEGITLLAIVSARMFLAHGFLARVFDVFHRHRTVVHAVASSEVSITAAIDDTERLRSIVQELESFATVNVSAGKAIVCVVGEGLAGNTGIAARLLTAAGDVEVNMISQGASEINIGFVIDEGFIEPVVRRLHDAFFNTKAEKEAA